MLAIAAEDVYLSRAAEPVYRVGALGAAAPACPLHPTWRPWMRPCRTKPTSYLYQAQGEIREKSLARGGTSRHEAGVDLFRSCSEEERAVARRREDR